MKYEINTRIIYAMRTVGLGLGGLKNFCTAMDLLSPPSQKSNQRILEKIKLASCEVAEKSMKIEAREEISATTLHTVYFRNFHYLEEYDVPWKDVIHYLTNLEVFSFHECTDEIMRELSKSCPNIVEIDVSSSKVTDEGIKYLCMKENGKSLCPKLKKVLIESSHVGAEGVTYLIQNFRSLDIIHKSVSDVLYSIHQNDLSSLNNIQPYNISSLVMYDFEPDFTKFLKICLSVCPFLKSLTCSVSEQEHLAILSDSLELEHLDLECLSTNIDFTDFIQKKGKNLKLLAVSRGSLSVATLSESCPCLKQLLLDKVTFKSVDNITSFESLERCFFSLRKQDSFTVKSVCLLIKNSPKLECLGFKGFQYVSEELRTEIISSFQYCHIKKIYFNFNEISRKFINDILISCSSLKKLNLHGSETNSKQTQKKLSGFAEKLPHKPRINFYFEKLDFCVKGDKIVNECFS